MAIFYEAEFIDRGLMLEIVGRSPSTAFVVGLPS